MNRLPFDRDLLIDLLIYHYRLGPGKGCGCGGVGLGQSWPAHIADMYEQALWAPDISGNGRRPPEGRFDDADGTARA
ncbi:MAG: hypothetical protein ACXVYY_00950 [Oryzihumus sp.]